MDHEKTDTRVMKVLINHGRLYVRHVNGSLNWSAKIEY